MNQEEKIIELLAEIKALKAEKPNTRKKKPMAWFGIMKKQRRNS